MSDSNISLTQASVLASEISLAKNYAIKTNMLVTNLSSDLNDLKTNVYSNTNDLNLIISKLEKLCNLLVQADISGVSDASLNYSNL